ADLALLLVGDFIVLFDVAFVAQHLGDAGADLALGDQDHAPSDTVGIANPSEHIRDGILVVHRYYRLQLLERLVPRQSRGPFLQATTSLLSSNPGSFRPVPARAA